MQNVNKLPVIEISEGFCFYRVQLTKPIKNTLRIGDVLMPPANVMNGRYSCEFQPTAYFADSGITALYEALFRRERSDGVPLEDLRRRSLIAFLNQSILRLVDIRGVEEEYPLLQSQRLNETRRISSEVHRAGFDGIIYSSAQHPRHDCVCLYSPGIEKMKLRHALSLVRPGSNALLELVVEASRRSALEIVP